jgi:hypothetical protein
VITKSFACTAEAYKATNNSGYFKFMFSPENL